MQDFTKGNTAKQILLFSLPMLIGNIFQQFYSMADAFVVGRFIGGGALAAIGSSMALINFLIGALIGLTTGASVVISQCFGAKQEENLKRAVSTSIVFLAGLSVLISVIGFIFSPVFLRLLNTPSEIFDMSVSYLRVILSGILFPVFYNMYMAYMRALGNSRSPLYILIFATLLNVGLDILFVAGFSWGVTGAAWATILSQSISMVLCILYANRYVPLLKVEKLIFDRLLFIPILKNSLPAALQISMTSFAMLTITRLINSFGALAVAGYTAAQRIDMFAMMPLQSLSMAVSTFVGQNMGAGLEQRAKKGLGSTMLFMVTVGIVMSVFVLFFGRGLISLFINKADPNAGSIIIYGSDYLSVISMFYVFFAVFFSFNGFFRGAGDAVIVMILTISSLTIRAVSAYYLAGRFNLGPAAVGWSIPIGWGLCSLFAWYYYSKGFWRNKAIVGNTPGDDV